MAPLRIALGKLVEIPWNLDQSSRYARLTRVVLALVGVDVALLTGLETDQCLIGLALTTLDRDISDIDRIHKEFFCP